MKEHVSVDNPSKLGRMAISSKCIESIANKATEEIAGAKVARKKKIGFVQLNEPVHVHIHNSGIVDIDVEVVLQKSCKVKDTCEKIQESIAHAIESSIEGIKYRVSIKVVKMI